MLYSCLKIFARLARPLFCRTVTINTPELLKANGPLLLAANHPNSFLDAILLDSLFDQPIWSLARGDVFKNKMLTRLLTAIKILPVYRVSEGVENLSTNYETFDACKKIFRRQGLVLIFSEGMCVNEWHLRPLKKGTARLAISSWKEEIPLSILPIGINYNSFTCFGKNVVINIGDPILRSDLPLAGNEGQNIQSFNELLTQRLRPLVFEIAGDDETTRKQLLDQPPSLFTRIVLAIPALAGWLLHQPLYAPIKFFATKKASGTGHYDSVLIALLFLTYPFYLLFTAALIYALSHQPALMAFTVILPLTAYCATKFGAPCNRTHQ